ncbi:MAG: DUF3750 domain-containing protein [Cyclobacteriaceae bacterium]
MKKSYLIGKTFRWLSYFFILVAICAISGTFIRALKDNVERKPTNTSDPEWSDRSYGYAPHPDTYDGAVIQVYAARTRGVKKALAVHTWVAFKKKGASQYIVAQIFGWRLKRNGTALRYETRVPDRAWAGNPPTVITDLRGKEAEKVIEKLEIAIKMYPWKDVYTVWPGPNSNTFTAWLGIQIPELKLDLPSTAIGKDWRPLTDSFGTAASGTGWQLSLYGLLGITIALEEGIEINILGVSTELDIFDLSIELPGIGRLW